MSGELASGWIVTGFQYVAALWIWVVVVLLNGFIRSLYQPEPDPIRPSGPIDT
jgi:hypothetical protein